jgi:hypothetical protein
MIRTVAAVAVIGLVAWVVLKLTLGVAGSLLGLLVGLCVLLLKIALVAGLIYWLLTVFSPETAKKVRDTLRGGQV